MDTPQCPADMICDAVPGGGAYGLSERDRHTHTDSNISNAVPPVLGIAMLLAKGWEMDGNGMQCRTPTLVQLPPGIAIVVFECLLLCPLSPAVLVESMHENVP